MIAAKDEIQNLPQIDLALGTNEKANIVENVENYINSKKEISIEDVMHCAKYVEFGDITYTEKTRAVIKVQDGCDRFWSYCIIPYARGRVRSREPQNVITEVKDIAKNGIKEVVITGIHVASYGKDLKNNYGLIDLLEEVNKIIGIERIRLGSIEPLWITDNVLERLKNISKLCHHFHLSLQSGCDETLKRMNRRYTIEEFKEIASKLRKAFKDVILTTDIIVGFPGETEEEFKETYNFLKNIKFYKMHIFKYSQRKGTKAASMLNQVSPPKKDERSKLLLELSNKNETEYLNKEIGENVEVLFEEKVGDIYQGHTSNYLLVSCESAENICNKILKVHITKTEKTQLFGNIM